MTFPNMTASELESRSRTFLNDTSSAFFTQAELYRWLSIAAKDIAQKTGCVRRVLSYQTTANNREVSFNAYKVFHVELITTGRNLMLTKIDPLRTGHWNLDGALPQYWYELGDSIGIDPIPTAVYNLRLYVADIPKIVTT